eukprot:13813589-Alexandrium_andersonii.AAC.1
MGPLSAATWARAARPFSRLEARTLQAACRGGVLGNKLPSADRWLIRLVGQGHYLDPDVRAALRLDSVLAVLL